MSGGRAVRGTPRGITIKHRDDEGHTPSENGPHPQLTPEYENHIRAALDQTARSKAHVDVQIKSHTETRDFMGATMEKLATKVLVPVIASSNQSQGNSGSQSTISQWSTPQSDPHLDYLKELARETGVQMDWDFMAASKANYKANRYGALMDSAVNSVAFFKGAIVNSNSVLALLGESYFAEVTNRQAQAILDRRIDFLHTKREEIEKKEQDITLKRDLLVNPQKALEKAMKLANPNAVATASFGELLPTGGASGDDTDTNGGNMFEDYYTIGDDGKMYTKEEGLEIMDIKEEYFSDEEKEKGKNSQEAYEKSVRESGMAKIDTSSQLVKSKLDKDQREILDKLNKYERIERKKESKRLAKEDKRGLNIDYTQDVVIDHDDDDYENYSEDGVDFDGDDYEESFDSEDYDSEDGNPDVASNIKSSDESKFDIRIVTKGNKRDKYEEQIEQEEEDIYMAKNYPQYSDDEEPVNVDEPEYHDDEELSESEDGEVPEIDSDDDEEYINNRGSTSSMIQEIDSTQPDKTTKPIRKNEAKIKPKDISNNVRFAKGKDLAIVENESANEKVEHVITSGAASLMTQTSILKNKDDIQFRESEVLTEIKTSSNRVMQPKIVEHVVDTVKLPTEKMTTQAENRTRSGVKDIVVEKDFDNEYDALMDAVCASEDEEEDISEYEAQVLERMKQKRMDKNGDSIYAGKKQVRNYSQEKQQMNEYDFESRVKNERSSNKISSEKLGEQLSTMYYNAQDRLLQRGMISRPDEGFAAGASLGSTTNDGTPGISSIRESILDALDSGFDKEREDRRVAKEKFEKEFKESNHRFAIEVLPDSEEKSSEELMREHMNNGNAHSEGNRTAIPLQTTATRANLERETDLVNGGFVGMEMDPVQSIPLAKQAIEIQDSKGKKMSRFKAARLQR